MKTISMLIILALLLLITGCQQKLDPGRGGFINFGNYDKSIWYIDNVLQVDSLYQAPDSSWYGMDYKGYCSQNYRYTVYEMNIKTTDSTSKHYYVTVSKETNRIAGIWRDNGTTGVSAKLP